jgi:hypothetical protein
MTGEAKLSQVDTYTSRFPVVSSFASLDTEDPLRCGAKGFKLPALPVLAAQGGELGCGVEEESGTFCWCCCVVLLFEAEPVRAVRGRIDWLPHLGSEGGDSDPPRNCLFLQISSRAPSG